MVDLAEISRQVTDTSFDLPLADGSRLRQLRPVRVVPGRRLVCRGEWDGRRIYVKLFIGTSAARHAERDAAGVRLLREADIATPELLHVGVVAQGEGVSAHVLVFAAIEAGVNAEELWRRLDENGRRYLAEALVVTVARHHNAGLRQTDLYLKNFLVEDGRIYSLDGDGMRRLPLIRARHAALDNLAILLSKFDVLETDAWLPHLLRTYAEHRAYHALPDLYDMARRVARYRQGAVRAYAERKVLRQCTDVVVRHDWRRFLAAVRTSAGTGLVRRLWQDPDALLEGEGCRCLKSGNTCTVGLMQDDDRKYVVKRYNIKSFRHWIGRFWRPSRAAASWCNAHRLLMYGVVTPPPVALLECRFGPLRGRAYFVAAYVDAPDIGQWLESDAVTDAQKLAGLRALARLMYKLQRLQIVHGDMKASNIRMDGTQPVLIDLDSMREVRCRHLFERGHVRDLRRLLRNWDGQSRWRQALADALTEAYGVSALLARVLRH
ncbi:MAG TPA: lipopolysaccharide kinase InaA family protein [Methylophilaceae bacterium]|jgi:tRNA A-37 threonylcarbamoyl transferase component Bud32